MAATAKDYKAAEIHQGPGDLWVIGTPPNDTAQRLTLDTASLTPDSVAHPSSIHLGAVASALTVIVQPKLDPIKVDQFAGPLDYFVTEEEMRIEAEMAQAEMQKLQRAIGVATYSTGAGFKQFTFGGTDIPPTAAIAIISPKRTDTTKAIVALLYKAVAQGAINLSITRSKAGFYKVGFMGLVDDTRTKGRQMGIVYETI